MDVVSKSIDVCVVVQFEQIHHGGTETRRKTNNRRSTQLNADHCGARCIHGEFLKAWHFICAGLNCGHPSLWLLSIPPCLRASVVGFSETAPLICVDLAEICGITRLEDSCGTT